MEEKQKGLCSLCPNKEECDQINCDLCCGGCCGSCCGGMICPKSKAGIIPADGIIVIPNFLKQK